MLNPLSLQMGQTCSGKEINNWCRYQVENNGSHYKDAVRLLKKNFKDDRIYYKTIKAKTAGCGEADVIEFDRVNNEY
ncbi:MAG: hypothetical protein J6M08_07410 [Methanobrevibacter sp.]|nr:hypothetical protein [Methanobrevibacter sp.]